MRGLGHNLRGPGRQQCNSLPYYSLASIYDGGDREFSGRMSSEPALLLAILDHTKLVFPNHVRPQFTQVLNHSRLLNTIVLIGNEEFDLYWRFSRRNLRHP